MEFFGNIIKGIMIGIANIIPGVSGGTMAVSLGIYDRLIGSISGLFREFKKSILFLIPIISAFLSWLSMKISTMTTPQVDKQQAQTNKSMMLVMPLVSLWICFTMPAALGVYWIAQSVFSLIQEAILNKTFSAKLSEEEEARFQARQADRQRRMEEARVQEQQRKQEEQKKKTFDYMPKFSIVIPVYKTPEKFLKEMLDSIVEQTYANWELCIADGSPAGESVENVLKKYAEKDARIRYQVLGENRGISGNTNAALEMAEGDFIVLADHDDLSLIHI